MRMDLDGFRSNKSRINGEKTGVCATCAQHGGCLGAAIQSAESAYSGNACVSKLSLRDGQRLYRLGEPVDKVYVVRSGALEVHRLTASTHEIVKDTRFPGDLAGLDEIGLEKRRSFATAVGTTQVCCIPMSAVQSQLDLPGPVADLLLRGLRDEFELRHSSFEQAA